MPSKTPGQLWNFNHCAVSGVVFGSINYVPHAEDPNWDACNFMITNFLYGRMRGKMQRFHNPIPIMCFGRAATYCGKNVNHGDEVIITGKLARNVYKNTKWDAQIMVDTVRICYDDDRREIDLVMADPYYEEGLPPNEPVIVAG